MPTRRKQPFEVTVDLKTGPRTAAWDELWRRMLADLPFPPTVAASEEPAAREDARDGVSTR